MLTAASMILKNSTVYSDSSLFCVLLELMSFRIFLGIQFGSSNRYTGISNPLDSGYGPACKVIIMFILQLQCKYTFNTELTEDGN